MRAGYVKYDWKKTLFFINYSRRVYFLFFFVFDILFAVFIKTRCVFVMFLDMSITLHRYGSGVRMGVMGDALIGPEHAIITKTFPKSVENLANVVGVPTILSRNSTPSPINPNTSPGH